MSRRKLSHFNVRFLIWLFFCSVHIICFFFVKQLCTRINFPLTFIFFFFFLFHDQSMTAVNWNTEMKQFWIVGVISKKGWKKAWWSQCKSGFPVSTCSFPLVGFLYSQRLSTDVCSSCRDTFMWDKMLIQLKIIIYYLLFHLLSWGFLLLFFFFFCFISVIFLLFLVSLRLYIGAFPFMCGDYSSFRENPFKNPLNIYCKSKKNRRVAVMEMVI